jgi:hypothetical protein
MPDNKLTITGFIGAMQRRYEARADLLGDQALQCALATLDAWETVFKEPVELTEECAHDIVDSDLEHWEAE